MAIVAISLMTPGMAHAATLDSMMQSFHDQVQKMIDGLEAQIQELQEKVDKWKSKAKSLEKQNEKLEAKIDRLQDGTFGADEAYQDLKAENKQLKKQLEKVRNIKENKKEQITDLNNTVTQLDGTYEQQEAIANAKESGESYLMTDKKIYTLGDTVHITGRFANPEPTKSGTYINGTNWERQLASHVMIFKYNTYSEIACVTYYPANFESFTMWQNSTDNPIIANLTWGQWYEIDQYRNMRSVDTCPITINADYTFEYSIEITERTRVGGHKVESYDAVTYRSTASLKHLHGYDSGTFLAERYETIPASLQQ